MWTHLFSYRLRCLLRDWQTLLWTLLFPIALGTLFYVAFGQLTGMDDTSFSPVPVAVVDNEAYQQDEAFRAALSSVGEASDAPLIAPTVCDAQTAQQLLLDTAVDGVIVPGETPALHVLQSGLNQSILQSFLDTYVQMRVAIAEVAAANPGVPLQPLIAPLLQPTAATQAVSLGSGSTNTMLSYFYALLAMACLYGCFWGMRTSTDLQANLSPLGMRRCIAPTHKLTVLLCDTLAALVVQLACILVLFAFLTLVFHIDFGPHIGYVLLTALIGSLLGILLGTFVGALSHKSEGLKTAILVGVTLVLSFLAGLMYVNMKQIIMQSAPVLAWLNPASLLSDAFYSLYMFGPTARFFSNLAALGGFCLLLTGGSYLLLRRQRYASV